MQPCSELVWIVQEVLLEELPVLWQVQVAVVAHVQWIDL